MTLALVALGGVFMLSAPDLAIATFDEAVRVGRDAGIVSSLSVALPLLAGMLPIEDSERASALLDEAIEVGTALGDRLGLSMVLKAQANISAPSRRVANDPPNGCRSGRARPPTR